MTRYSRKDFLQSKEVKSAFTPEQLDELEHFDQLTKPQSSAAVDDLEHYLGLQVRLFKLLTENVEHSSEVSKAVDVFQLEYLKKK